MKTNPEIIKIDDNLYRAKSAEFFDNYIAENPEVIVRNKILIEDDLVLYFLFFPITEERIYIEVPV